MKKSIYIAMMALFCSCATAKMMTHERYYTVSQGDDIAQIQAEVGRPYEVRATTDNTEEYVYIERIPLGKNAMLFREYVFIVADGKVMCKEIREKQKKGFHFSSN